jgi:hypothetical protein
LYRYNEALIARLPGFNEAGYDEGDAFGVEQSIRRLSPGNLRRFGLRADEAAYLYRCLAGFSSGFHDAVVGAVYSCCIHFTRSA